MVHLSQKGRPHPLSEMERKGAVRRACGSWEWQGSQGSHEQGEVLIGLAGKAERNLDWDTSYSQAATSPSSNGERMPSLQNKATCSLGSHFCPHLLQVLALGSPDKAGHEVWVGATDRLWPRKACSTTRITFAERDLWESLGEATE